TPEDIAKIVALVKQTTAERSINVLDVVPVSARKKKDYPAQPIVEFLQKWDEQKKGLSFAQNFKRQFLEYARFIEGQQRVALLKLNRLNRILTLAELVEIQEDAQELQLVAQADLEVWQKITELLRELQYKFFSKLKNIGNEVGIELPEPDELELLERSRVDIISLLKQVMENLDKTESTKSSTWDALIRPAKVENLDKLLRRIQKNSIFEQLMN
ncbi:MAG: hypothetical protein RSA87_04260, partial [Malacoplasma sp.]